MLSNAINFVLKSLLGQDLIVRSHFELKNF